MSTPKPFVVADRVRWADVDLVRIMRFSAFTRLVEVAEQELMRAAGWSYAQIFDAPTIYLPRRHLSIEYFAPARLDDELLLVTYVSRIGETSLTYNVDVRTATDNALVASAAWVAVCVTVESFTKCPLPEYLRQLMAPYVCSVADVRAWTPL